VHKMHARIMTPLLAMVLFGTPDTDTDD
jgi:hypothetical protein